VDAEFAGLCPHEDKQDLFSLKSRTGFTIGIFKLQTDIATSTMEAEYAASGMSMKGHFPL